ncbi:MAG: putative metal-binding motif-containing protein [Deltaproteobacteria bacterium]|nr:putative metal-binding motif-containing protein [Deltaproteobacteria bacterium]
MYNSAPQVSIVAPSDGTSVAAGSAVRFEASVHDGQTALSDLELSFGVDDGSVLDGELSFAAAGVVFVADGLPMGDRTVSLIAIDEQGESGEDTVLLHVIEDEAPTVTFLSPAEGEEFAVGDLVRVEVLAADPDEARLSDLVFAWGDAAAGASSAPAAPDSSGAAAFYLSGLEAGAHVISLTVTDSLGATASGAVAFSVRETDGDGDGHPDVAWGGDDCDDGDASVYPGADEACDGVDHDCDGVVDEDDALDAATWYADADGDGFGDPDETTSACEAPSGYVANATDCDDASAATYPGATEYCNAYDDDCDGAVDEDDAVDGDTWYADADGDGYGDAAVTGVACAAPSGYVADATDCDDASAATYPGATEYCNTYDDDCDGTTDEDDAADASTWYVDVDGDGAAGASTTQSCTQPAGTDTAATDCDDANASVYPGADEWCNTRDDDCDGTTDEDDALDAPTWYVDADGDGYGDSSVTTTACDQPSGFAATATDCDDGDSRWHPGASETDCDDPNDYNCDGSTGYADADADGWVACLECDDLSGAINPDAAEVCNGDDDDCDGSIDGSGAIDAITWYADADGDGYGDAGVSAADCDAPAGYVSDATDCDDTRALAYPGATETCNTYDDDCDGAADEDAAMDAGTWYADADGDGYGDATVTYVACAAPSGYVASATDCDDASAATYPGATEYCNSDDDDCDGTTDEDDAADATTWYRDADADGYGTASASDVSCTAPTGYVSNSTDCDDGRAASYPGATEYCNSYDDDCDGTTDEDAAVDATTWYRDADSDGYGSASVTDVACSRPSGYVADATDCDDGRAASYPGATEYCNSYDDDCDGTTDEDDAADVATWYRDADADGYGTASLSDIACSAPSGYVANATDCDDGRAASYPGATEYCNSYDDDCDGTTDESSAADAATWYADADSDGYGSSSSASTSCTAPTGYVSNSTDCDDGRAASYPGATEYCNSYDDDCDGTTDEDAAVDATTWYRDADADSYGSASVTDVACSRPSGYVADATDCDDGRAASYPGATEYCNSYDDDCDGTTDEDDAADAATWYLDADADGYGLASSTTTACDAPAGYAELTEDCDDGSSSVNPGATETCDGVDNDCDGAVDFVDEDLDADGYSTCDLDCDDSDADVHPGMHEVCGNGVDDDCDGTADGGDSDGDGYDGCGAEDCNDYSDLVYPGATEITDDRLDNDCDGTVDDEGVDDDDDGYTEDAGDCDDAAPWIGPGAVEIPDTEVDEDCDGVEEYAIDWSSTAIFVDADLGSDYFPGTQEYPVATLGRGVSLALAAGSSVVAAEGTYVENVSVSVHIFGGYAADWSTATGLSVVEGSLTYPSAASGLVVSGLEIDGVVEVVGDGIFYGGAVYADSSEAWAADSTLGSLGIAESVIMGPQTYTSGDIATVVVGAGGGWVYDSAVVGGVAGNGADGADGSGTTLVETYRPWAAGECDSWDAPQGNDGSSGTDGAAVVSWKVEDGGQATVAGTLVLGGSAGRGGEGGAGADGTQTAYGYGIWHGPGGSGGDGGNSGEVVLVLSDDGSVELVGSLLSGGTLAEGGSGGAGGDANSGTCETTCREMSGVPATKLAWGGAGGDAGSASAWYGVRGAVSAWGTSILGPAAIEGVSEGGSVGMESTCCSGASYPYCYGDPSASSGASAEDPTLTAFEDAVSSSATTIIGNRVLLQEADLGGGWGDIVDGVPFSPSAVTGLSLGAATVSRNVVSLVTAGTATGIDATGTVTGHSNLVEILGTDDAVGIALDGESCLMVNSTVVLDGAGIGIWTSGSTMVGLVNNLVQTGSGGTCLEDDTSTRSYLRNNLVWGCTSQLYHDSAGYRTRAAELNFVTTTVSAGGHLYTSPSFTDEAASDYSLSASSSAVNAGYDVSSATFGSVAYDVAGDTCPSGGSYDIGAYER